MHHPDTRGQLLHTLKKLHHGPIIRYEFNMFTNGKLIFLVDFDYSGQNDPIFELGNLCVDFMFSRKPLPKLQKRDRFLVEINTSKIQFFNM